jgi:hypothetical protein
VTNLATNYYFLKIIFDLLNIFIFFSIRMLFSPDLSADRQVGGKNLCFLQSFGRKAGITITENAQAFRY